MKKEFIFNINGEPCVMAMTQEQMIEKFLDSVKSFANECLMSFEPRKSRIYNNIYEFEDYVQIGLMELINCYFKYDIEKGNCFSTYLHGALALKQLNIAREITSMKRRIEKPSVSLNQESKYDASIESLYFGKGDKYFREESGFDNFLMNNLTEEERSFLAMGLQKQVKKAENKTKRECIEYAIAIVNEKSLIDTTNLTKEKLAEALKISRPTLNTRIKKTMEKVYLLAQQYQILKCE